MKHLVFMFLSFGCCLMGCRAEIVRDNPFDPKTPLRDQARGIVRGTVFLESRTDHSGVRVSIVGRPDLDALTDSKGAFEIREVPKGTYELAATFSDPLYLSATSAQMVHLKLGETKVIPSMTLKKRPAPPLMAAAVRESSTEVMVEMVRSPDTDVQLHSIYFRTRDDSTYLLGGTSNSLDPTFSILIPELLRGRQYFFKGTATDNDLLESELSLDAVEHFISPIPTVPNVVIDLNGIAATFNTIDVCNLAPTPDGLSVYYAEPANHRIRKTDFPSMHTSGTPCGLNDPMCIDLSSSAFEPGPLLVSPDGTTLFASTSDGKLLVIDTETRTPSTPIGTH